MNIKVFITVFFFYQYAFADSFYIETVEGTLAKETTTTGTIDRSAEIKSTLRSLLESSLLDQNQTLVENSKKAQWTISPRIVRLGKAYVISLFKKNAEQIVFSEKMKATTFSDADVVSDRLVRSIISETKVAATETVDKVTQDETRGTTIKKKALKQIFFGFGPGGFSNLGDSATGFYFSIGYLWGLDHQFSLRLHHERLELKNSDALTLNVGVGGQYYLNRNVHSPYVLGLLTFGYSQADEPPLQPTCSLSNDCYNIDDVGFGTTLGVGMHFYRTTNVNFAAEASYNIAFYNVLGKAPGSWGLKVKILW